MKSWTDALGLIVAFAAAISSSYSPATEQPKGDYPYRPVPCTTVHFADTFWAPRIETNHSVTVPFAFQKCEETGRIENFKVAGGLSKARWRGGAGFDDSDVSKVIEGAAYCMAARSDPKLDAYLDQIISYYAAAQEPDGFLYTLWTARDTVENFDRVGCRPNRNDRWSNGGSAHQLYNAGHMFEAAVAHYQATGKRSLLDVAIKNADLICDTFGPGKAQTWPPGHQEIEIGLVKLYRATGNRKYLDQAKYFLDIRGRADTHRLYGPYSQDHKPVVEQTEAVGHAVRAVYMYSGMADVAALTGDEGYLKAMQAIWENVVGRKLYVTGGIGARGAGEAFGDDYELPNLSAYCETCAAIGHVFWNHRLFLLHGDAKYIDVLERSLYNGVISGVSMDGKLFFYPNPLESDGRHQRSPWFGCACCPSNVCRFMASIPGYAYAHRNGEVYVNLFVSGEAEVPIDDAGEAKVVLRQQTNYPWDGTVKIELAAAKSGKQAASPGKEWTLCVRIPGWARNEPVPSDLYRFAENDPAAPELFVNGEKQAIAVERGYARVTRQWKPDDTVELRLPMPIRRVLAHDKVEANRGRVALQRGPLVYCVEWPDVPQGQVLNLLLRDEAKLSAQWRDDLLGGVTVISTEGFGLTRAGGNKPHLRESRAITAIPYYAWAHRGPGEMAVWLARDEAAAVPLPAPTVASKAKASASGGDVKALNDQREPKSSGDHSHRFLHWWPRKGTKEWVQYDLAQPTEVSAVEVYWFDDTGRGECRIPAGWQLFYRDGDQWRPVAKPSGFDCKADQYNRSTFEPVKTTGLRIEVQLPEKFSSGIHEWRVE